MLVAFLIVIHIVFQLFINPAQAQNQEAAAWDPRIASDVSPALLISISCLIWEARISHSVSGITPFWRMVENRDASQ